MVEKLISDLQLLKQSDLPTYLYGAGELAEEFLYRFVIPNNIAITGVVVSTQYYKEGSTFRGHLI